MNLKQTLLNEIHIKRQCYSWNFDEYRKESDGSHHHLWLKTIEKMQHCYDKRHSKRFEISPTEERKEISVRAKKRRKESKRLFGWVAFKRKGKRKQQELSPKIMEFCSVCLNISVVPFIITNILSTTTNTKSRWYKYWTPHKPQNFALYISC